MKVTSLDLVPYALPFERPYTTARGTIEQREMLLVRLHTDEGLEGLGEAVALSLRGGADLDAIVRGIRKVARRFRRADLSDFSGEEPFMAAVDTFIHVAAGRRLPAPAKAALEMAIFDLAGKASGRPVHSLLNAEEAQPVSCNATLVAGTPDEVAADAQRWAARGFSTFKLKLGTGDDVAQVRAVREIVGADARIRVDANGAWGTEEAAGILRLLEPLDIELVEQPVSDDRDMAQLTRDSTLKIAADESVNTSKDARRAAENKVCDLATVKLAKVGGIGEANGIAGQLPIYLSSALDGPVGIAAAAHAAQALSFEGPAAGLAHGLATQLLFSSSIAATECDVRDGELNLPGGAGLGIEIDPEALEAHRI
jgi:o-succinylbenzoate synthase